MKNIINGSIATCSFELSQFNTIPRLAFTGAMALFPPGMLVIILGAFRLIENDTFPFSLMVSMIFTYLVCVLSILLWATPNVYTELEAKSWIFNVCRPRGRISTFLGKYLASVIYSCGITFIATTLSVILIQLATGTFSNPFVSWFKINLIFFCACAGYSAIFSMIGTIFYRRAMVIAAAYMILSEAVLGSIPAVVSQMTMRFHLQALSLHWFEDSSPITMEQLYDVYVMSPDTSYWYHLGCIVVGIIITLSIGGYIITTREYATGDET